MLRKLAETCSVTRTIVHNARALVLEEQEPGEGGVHVSVEVGRLVPQQQPDLVTSLKTDDDRVGRGAPVRDALRPHSRYHLSVLDNHHRSLPHHTSTWSSEYIAETEMIHFAVACSYMYLRL